MSLALTDMAVTETIESHFLYHNICPSEFNLMMKENITLPVPDNITSLPK